MAAVPHRSEAESQRGSAWLYACTMAMIWTASCSMRIYAVANGWVGGLLSIFLSPLGSVRTFFGQSALLGQLEFQ